jgi:hypothetical protein
MNWQRHAIALGVTVTWIGLLVWAGINSKELALAQLATPVMTAVPIGIYTVGYLEKRKNGNGKNGDDSS